MVTVNPFDQDFLFEIMDLNSFFIDCALFVASPPPLFAVSILKPLDVSLIEFVNLTINK
jgi:hypothetical protein